MQKTVQIIVMFLISVLVSGSISCSKKTAHENNNLVPGKIFKKGMTMTVTTQGRKEYVVDADTLVINETDDTFVNGDVVRVAFYNINNAIENTIASDKGRFDIRTKDVVLTGNVVLKNVKENIIVYTEELIYMAQKQRIYSLKPVKIERDGSTMFGDSMETDLTLNEIQIKNIRGSK